MDIKKLPIWQKTILLIFNQLIYGVLFWMLVPSVFNLENNTMKIALGLCVVIGFIFPNDNVCNKLIENSTILKIVDNISWIIAFSYMYFTFGPFASLI